LHLNPPPWIAGLAGGFNVAVLQEVEWAAVRAVILGRVLEYNRKLDDNGGCASHVATLFRKAYLPMTNSEFLTQHSLYDLNAAGAFAGKF